MQREPSSALSDEALMESMVRGDEAAFEELARRLEGRLHSFALRQLRESDTARDLVQETLLRLWRHRAEYRRGSRLSTWVFAILLNLCRDHLRRQNRLSSLERPEVAMAAESMRQRAGQASPLDRAELSELASLLHEALEALPPLQGRLLRLRNDENLSFAEAGRRLGLSATAARAVGSRAYKKLRSWMQKKLGEV